MMADNDSAEPDALADFEKSLAELESLVETLESGEVDLQEALTQFERGVALARSCQDALKTAELRVEQLSESGGQTSVEAFEPPSDDQSA